MRTKKKAGSRTRKQKNHYASALSILTVASVLEIAALALFLPKRAPASDSTTAASGPLKEVTATATVEKEQDVKITPDPTVNTVAATEKSDQETTTAAEEKALADAASDARAAEIATKLGIRKDEEARAHPHPGYGEKLPEESRLQALIGARRVGFRLKFDDFDTNLSLITVSRLPGESIDFSVTESKKDSEFVFEPNNGLALVNTNNRWNWKTPDEPGIYGVDIREKNSGEIMRVQVAVQVPYDGSEYIGGYRIGQYEDEPYRGSPRYNKPKGFIKVNEEDLDTWVSPHLQLKQFICKQQGDFPKYTLLDSRLLVKLELVIDSLEEQGIEANKLHLTSGFRTPFYNKAIGNKTNYSRHCYGDAADLFVDVDGDGRMDDLDADGDLTDNDGALLHATAHEIQSENEHLIGGLGFYGLDRFRNPFIHVDTRGYEARWPADWQSRLETGKSLMAHNHPDKTNLTRTES